MALTMLSSTSAGQVYFDAVFKITHTSNVTVTTQPVQSGANIADHAYVEPDTVTLEIGMTDAAVDAEENHSVNAFNLLKAIMEEREPISVYTRLKSYIDMLVVAMAVDDDYTTSTALRANIMLQKIIMVDVGTVTVQKTVSASKNNGNNNNNNNNKKEDKKDDTNKSLLKEGYDDLSKAAPEIAETLASGAKMIGGVFKGAGKLLGDLLGIGK